jgi:site-specific DNA-cytosine methylase
MDTIGNFGIAQVEDEKMQTYDHHPQDGRVTPSDVTHIDARAGTGGGNQVPDVICVHGSQDPISNTEHANAVNRNNGLENCICQYGESAGTLTERHDSSPCPDRGQNVVAFESGQAKRDGGENRYVDDASPTIRSNMGDNQTAVASTKLSVRRLLPVECERLQGMPDNWTKIPWRGKPAEECPDAPRYKACGNSMGVNCMRWIGLGIEAVENGIRQKQQQSKRSKK